MAINRVAENNKYHSIYNNLFFTFIDDKMNDKFNLKIYIGI